MPSGSLSFIAASLFVLAVILGFVWNPLRSLASRLADRIYFWRFPIARFVEDATALAIEVPSAEVLAASQNPAHWTRTAQRQRAAKLRQTYGVRTLGSRERQALQAERRRRKGHGVIQFTR